ncbi:MAG: SAM-dependent methyltransferase [Halioglobus sp.]|nr:SAM-dependent methyltransferase [Halioglobus sp.]|tara:strand:- start:766 stop:1506 length:741 start_codon:yes stop_codon:yes gene_type:complete
MRPWRFLAPNALGFTLRTARQALVDKLRGAPSRPAQVADYVARHARQGDPADVLATIDRFAREERWLMNIGPDKGPLVQEMAQRLPAQARILELGAYCGYSSIMLAAACGPQAHITSIEVDADAVDSSRHNVEAAGLSQQVAFVHGSSTQVIPTLEGRFDLVFLDHWKDLYKRDLQLIEERGLIGPGSIVVADNVGDIFNPDDFLDYVRHCGRYTCEQRAATIEYTDVPDAVEICVYRGAPQAPAA